jgi:hypothetical protein
LNQNSIDGVIVFVYLSGKVLLWIVRARVGDLLCSVAPNFIGFSDAKPALPSVGFSSNSNGCSCFFQLFQTLSLLYENNVGLLEFLNASLEPRTSIDNPQRLLTFKAEPKPIQNGWPTRCDDKIVTVMVVGKTKDHRNTFRHAMLNEGPRFGGFPAEYRGKWSHFVAGNHMCVQVIDAFRP